MSETGTAARKAAVPKGAGGHGGAKTPPIPEGKALFFCIGAQKAGTSWLANYFAGHPECRFSVDKEMHYFDVTRGGLTGMIRRQADVLRHRVNRLHHNPQRDYGGKLNKIEDSVALLQMYRPRLHGDTQYMKLMLKRAGDARILCDFTPEYGHLDADGMRELACFADHRPYFLFVMRDPVERLWSQIRMEMDHRGLAREKWPKAARELAESMLADGPLAKGRYNDYRHTLETLDASVAADRRRVLFMEELFDQETLDGLCDFLGVGRHEADFSPVHEGRPLDLPRDLRKRMRKSLDDTYRYVARRFPDRRPKSWAWDG
ncbi:MAG: sulfotransferase [Pseudomonadota bacterium]